MKQKACVITGGTSGIGRAAAFELGRLGANLAIIGRNETRGREAVARVLRFAPTARVQFFRCDLTAPSKVLDVAQSVREMFGTIDVLVNNAGARFDTFGANPDGIERTFAGNHLGHFLLTALLLDPLLKSPAARVVTLGSSAHRVTPPDGWVLTEGTYDRKLAYGSSKLANIMFTYELARRLAGTQMTANALDPGVVVTRFGSNNGLKAWLKHVVYHALTRRLVSSRKGADTVVYLAAAESLRGHSGKYYNQRAEIRSSPASYDTAVAKQLWQLSLELVRLQNGVPGNSELARRIMLRD